MNPGKPQMSQTQAPSPVNPPAGSRSARSAAARCSARWLAVLAAAPLLLACGPAEEADQAAEPAAGEALIAEEAFPGRTGELRTALLETADGTESISYQLIDGYMVHQGDIILGKESGQYTAQSATLRTATWAGCVIPYEIHPSLPNKKRVTDAINHWTSRANVQFVPHTNQKDYVVFENDGKGCFSWIGRAGGRQSVSLADNCNTGSAIHEIGHTIGLYHEQSRQDRDSYVTVLYDNVQSNQRFNFDKYRSGAGRDVGAFDFNSIMIYGPNFFSRNGKPTLVHKDGTPLQAQRSVLSSGDLGGAARLCGK